MLEEEFGRSILTFWEGFSKSIVTFGEGVGKSILMFWEYSNVGRRSWAAF